MKRVKLLCVSGIVQYFDSLESMLLRYNSQLNIYAVKNGNELWHKSHNLLVGKVEFI